MRLGDVGTEVWVARADFGRDIQIAVVQSVVGGQFTIAHVIEGGHLEFTEQARGMIVRPTLRLSEHLAEQLLAGLLNEKVSSPTAGAIEGELKATKHHLDDLRRLLRIPKRPEA